MDSLRCLTRVCRIWMVSASSSVWIFSVSLYLMEDLMPRSTLRRSSSLARMASIRSFWIFSARVMRFNIAEEKERKRIYTEGAEGTEFTENRSEDLTASEWLATVDILT